jgi:hypothetical protein
MTIPPGKKPRFKLRIQHRVYASPTLLVGQADANRLCLLAPTASLRRSLPRALGVKAAPTFRLHLGRNFMTETSIRRVMALTTLLAIALISTGAQARNCQKIGNQVFCDDGVSYQQIGNQTFGSDGSSSQQIGNQRFNNDGSSSQQIGNQRFNSDGSSSQRIGNQIFKSDGTSCQIIGNQMFCN